MQYWTSQEQEDGQRKSRRDGVGKGQAEKPLRRKTSLWVIWGGKRKGKTEGKRLYAVCFSALGVVVSWVLRPDTLAPSFKNQVRGG
jgi:hypothetical protein